ncbi:MAG: hypothetical protein R3A50_07555 [Saprospiraceae bacterium]
MRRISSLAILLIGISSVIIAQKPVVKLSPELKLPKTKEFISYLCSDATGHYVYFYNISGSPFGGYSYTPVLEKYDQTFKLQFSKEYKSDRKGISSLGMRYFNNQIVWLYSETNKKDDYIRYSLMPLGLDGKQGKSKDIAKFKYEKRSDRPATLWSISRDSSKLMFSASSDNDNKEDKYSIFLSVMDQGMNVLWSRRYKLGYTEEQVQVMATQLKNDGSVFILAKVYEGKRAKESKKSDGKKSVAAYDMKLFHFTATDETAQEFELRLGDSFIRSAFMTTDNSDNMKCAGFYSNTKSGSLQGVFYLEIGADGNITASSKKSFTVDDLKKFGKKNTDKDRTGDIGLEDSFKFNSFMVRDNGSAVVVAEENYSVTYTRYNGRTYTTTTRYYSNDIIILSINTRGEIDRVNIIPKRQSATDTNFFLSYASVIHGDDVVFYYNEDKDNLNKPIDNPKPDLTSNFKKCVAVMTTLSPDGKLSRKQLFGTKDVESLFVPNDSSPYETTNLFFTTLKPKLFAKSNFRMGTITLPE